MYRFSALVRLFLVVVIACSAWASAWAKAPDAKKVAKVEAALPGACRVKPKGPRKLLVFNLCRGFVHGSIPLGAKALELMGKKTGAYEAVVSSDPAMFEAASLKQFDAVCLNNTTGPLFLPANFDKLSKAEQKAAQERDAALKKSFLAFVRGGKGLVGVHAATDCFYEWADYGAMIGAYFDGHPWGSGDTVGVKLDDPGHPVCAAFGGGGFQIKDEIYQFGKVPYSRAKLRVLLSIDHQNTDMKKKGLKRADGDYAIAWVRSFGKGRVFYCSLGHNESVFWDAKVLQHYLDGIQFAMGDLAADTTPSAELSAGYFEESRRKAEARVLDALLAKIARYEYGQKTEDLTRMAAMVVESHHKPVRRKEIAVRLAGLLDGEATLAGKQFVCRQLWRIGGKEVVPALGRLLADEKTADMARYGLERMPDPAAGAALRGALGKAKGSVKVGIINSLGERRDKQAAGAVTRLAHDPDRAVAEAAIVALGKIGGGKTIAALSEAKGKVPAELVGAVDEALLQCADRLAAKGEAKKAEDIYEALYQEKELSQTRAAALKGLIAVRKDGGVPLVVGALDSDDVIVRSAAGGVARKMTSAGATALLAKALSGLKADGRVLLVHALADRGDRAALSAIRSAAVGGDAAVRVAALGALAKLGDASCVALLAKATAAGDGAEAGAARNSLNALKGADVDAAIVRAMDGAQAKMRVELIRSLAARYAYDTVPALLTTAADSNEAVRVESWQALGALAGEKDLPRMVKLLVNETSDGARGKAEAAVVTVAKKIGEPGKRASAALAVFPSTQENISGRCALVRVLGQLGDESTLEPLRADLKSSNAKVREAAIRALAEWSTPAPLADLYEVAEKEESEGLRLVGLRAYLRLLEAPSDRPAAETLKMYEKGLALASGVQEKKIAIAGLAEVADRRAAQVIKRYENDEALKADVATALEKARKRARKVSASHNTDEAKLAIDGDIKTRWTTGTGQQNGQWFMVDLGWEVEVRKVVLDAGSSKGDYPRGYEVYVSNDPERLGEPVATGEGTGAKVEIRFKPKAGRYVRIVQTKAEAGLWWSIHEVKVQTSDE